MNKTNFALQFADLNQSGKFVLIGTSFVHETEARDRGSRGTCRGVIVLFPPVCSLVHLADTHVPPDYQVRWLSMDVQISNIGVCSGLCAATVLQSNHRTCTST